MKKYKLKKWVKNALTTLFLVLLFCILIHLICFNNNKLNKIAIQCDNEKGYTCSYYEIRQFSLGK